MSASQLQCNGGIALVNRSIILPATLYVGSTVTDAAIDPSTQGGGPLALDDRSRLLMLGLLNGLLVLLVWITIDAVSAAELGAKKAVFEPMSFDDIRIFFYVEFGLIAVALISSVW
ncbi:MAG TPA: hypothetical protein VGC79_29665, partial [Polyangiaceae bacterium]